MFSSGTCSGWRLVARMRTLGQSRSTAWHSSAIGPTACSQVSRSSSRCWVRRAVMIPSNRVAESPWTAFRPAATVRSACSWVEASLRSMNRTPSGKRRSTRSARWRASLVLPIPPVPVRVTIRAVSSRRPRSTMSRSRPTNRMNSPADRGRLWRGGDMASITRTPKSVAHGRGAVAGRPVPVWHSVPGTVSGMAGSGTDGGKPPMPVRDLLGGGEEGATTPPPRVHGISGGTRWSGRP